MKSRFAFILALGALAVLSACSKVPAGNVGVKYYLLGGDKGVDTEVLSPGRYYIGINEELYLFPTFTQTYVWSNEVIDGDATDESIKFQDKDSLEASADIGITYSLDKEKIPLLFQKYRKGIDEITDTFLRRIVQDSFVKAASDKSISDMAGTGKETLLNEVFADVRDQVSAQGIIIEKLYSTGAFRLPAAITASINEKIKATQVAQQKENELRAALADAEKVRATAQGQADASLTLAEAEAKAIRVKGEALRENQRLVELSAIEKWNGVLPVYQLGGATPFINVPSPK